MTATRNKIDRLLSLLRKEQGDRINQCWQIDSVLTVPAFVGEVGEIETETRHGIYTAEEIGRPEYQIDGWVQSGYRIVKVFKEDDGFIVVTLKQGAIRVIMNYRQYA